ncbi:MAG: DUF3300 domain-containing protein [Acidimicrobiales bacterium]
MRKALAVSLALCLSSAPLVNAAPRSTAESAPLVQDEGESGYFSPEQLDNLLAPIALYPDPLLAQVLLAATFVDEVDEAARYVRAYGQADVDDQPWDVSVKSVAHYPVILDNLADRLDWTTSVGQAYAAQSTDVMISVQRLRRLARSQGNLETTPEQEVVDEDDNIQIVPAQPTLIYVPRYNPAIVYYQRPAFGLAISFGAGLAIGAWLNDDFDWRGHRVYYHGWSGGGWVGRSRSHVHVTNVYVSPRYSTVTVNHRVADRHVDYGTLNRYNSVHRNVTYDNVRSDRDRHPPVSPRPPGPGNAVIERNINTRDPRLDHYRGRDDQPRPTPNARVVPHPQPVPTAPHPVPAARPEPPPRPGPHAYGKTEYGFDPGAASRRGQSSREAASKPPEARHAAPKPAPNPSEPPPKKKNK